MSEIPFCLKHGNYQSTTSASGCPKCAYENVEVYDLGPQGEPHTHEELAKMYRDMQDAPHKIADLERQLKEAKLNLALKTDIINDLDKQIRSLGFQMADQVELQQQLAEAKLCPNGKDHSKEYCDPCTDYRINREYELCIVKNKEIESLQQQLAEANERIEIHKRNELNQFSICSKLKDELTQLRQERDRLQKMHSVMIQCSGCGLTTISDCTQEAEIDMAWVTQKEWDQLETECDTLRAELDQWKSAARTAVDEECTKGEKHCTCVPLLRAEVERLKALHPEQCILECDHCSQKLIETQARVQELKDLLREVVRVVGYDCWKGTKYEEIAKRALNSCTKLSESDSIEQNGGAE